MISGTEPAWRGSRKQKSTGRGVEREDQMNLERYIYQDRRLRSYFPMHAFICSRDRDRDRDREEIEIEIEILDY
jgi:hypothetical protein